MGDGMITDLSHTGLGIYGNTPVTPGMELAIFLFLHDQKDPLFVMETRVAWTSGRRFGVEILMLNLRERNRLRHFLCSNLTTPIRLTFCCKEHPMAGRRRAGTRATIHPPVQTTDRRAAQRVSVQLMVRFSATDSFQYVGDGVALDLSEGGCKLRSTQTLPTGSLWDLDLTIHKTSPPILISEVRVVRVAGHECGIEFLRVAARERTRLRHFLWKQMTRSTLEGGPALFALVNHSSPRRPHLKSLP